MKNFVRKFVALFFLILLPSCSCSKSYSWGAEEKKSDVVVINVLSKQLYDDCHIKGSLNVPFMDEENPDISPIEKFTKDLDKETKIVVYCSNYMCTASGEIAKKLSEMGFENVWAYEAGMAEWYQENLPVEGTCNQKYLAKKLEKPVNESHEGFKEITTTELKKLLDL